MPRTRVLQVLHDPEAPSSQVVDFLPGFQGVGFLELLQYAVEMRFFFRLLVGDGGHHLVYGPVAERADLALRLVPVFSKSAKLPPMIMHRAHAQ